MTRQVLTRVITVKALRPRDVNVGRASGAVWKFAEYFEREDGASELLYGPYGQWVAGDGRTLKPTEVGYFGNPVALGKQCPICWERHEKDERTGALRCYRVLLYRRLARDLAFRAAVHGLRGRRLACYCAPAPCHGDVLAAVADGRDGCFLCGTPAAAAYVYFEDDVKVCSLCFRGL